MSSEISFAGYSYSPDKECLICEHVFDRSAEPVIVAHDTDGWLQALCGEEDHDADQSRIVALSEIIDRLPKASELPVLNPGECAERTADGSWQVFSIDDE